MRKLYLLLLCAVVCTFAFISCQQAAHPEVAVATENSEEKDEEGYDGPAERAQLDFEKVKDPALGYAPTDRLMYAIEAAVNSKRQNANRTSALLWIERGPIYDSVGPSNGNARGGGGYTAGRIRGVLVDKSDPTGNTVFCGGVAGGLWKCTNFMSGAVPNWQVVNDYFDNLAVSSICQDPTNPAIMYFATGEATSNSDAVFGRGVWKSTNGGSTWTQLPSTINYIRNFRILCDASGYVYLAARPTGSPVAQSFGLVRSKNGGTSWENITPTGLTSNSTCTDIEISSTGKLHASFGYVGTIVNHRYTSDPANVTPSTWSVSTGIRTGAGAPTARRMELDCVADTLYAITTSSTDNVDSCYKSIDGGATWTKQNTAAFASGLGSGQAWYNLTLSINPANTSQIIMGGLDAYKSVNSGQTASRITYWVTTVPYVHADHHFIKWWQEGAESRVIIGCDGGMFLSKDAGSTWVDRNRNLGIKQFYSASIHPDAGSNYLLAGAQDNGSHQLKNPGLSYSIEVTGGDGCFVHINQQNPQIQFTSYVYNQYRRSTNGGQTWTPVNLSGTTGMFINPFDYDDGQNIMYASNGANTFRRWPNANTATASTVLTATDLGGGTPSAFKVSPYTANRVFIGTSNGRLVRLENANTVTAADIAANVTSIRGSSFSGGYISCINTGTSDDNLVAVFSNYGVTNVWVSSDGGANWTGIDGNLPDMPVRWAVFEPGRNDRLILATEAGIWTTDNINGNSTVWVADGGFPTVRTDMLKVRTSDNTIVAATHGRGLFTAVIPTTTAPEVRFVSTSTITEEDSTLKQDCRGYKDYAVSIGIVNAPSGDATVTYSIDAGGSATRGPDFEFTTNGNFAAPSSQHVFTSGVVGAKTLTVRVYDDEQVESPETFTISFAVSGATNAIAGTARTHTVTINDNDHAPHAPANLTASFGVNNTALSQPFRAQYSDARTQIVYLASELQAAGFRAGNITSLGFNVVAKNSTAPFENFTIKLKNTTRATATGGAFETGASTVYGPVSYSTVAGANNFTLTTPFYWDGTSNVLIDICYDNATGTVTDNVAGTAGLSLCHFERVDNASGCAIANAGFTFSGGARPDVSFSISTTGTIVAAALNAQKTAYMHANNDLYYYTPSGELIARVRNLSAHNYGCTQVMIDRAGTGAARFWNFSTANYLMNKTFRIVPAANNATGRYEVTFYYTRAEKEGWEAATGQLWNNIQLVKVPSSISAVTPTNAQPDGPGTVQVVTPIRGTFGDGYTLTYTFENGFSGFGAGVPGRINTMLTLTGRLDASGIVLDWTTSAEMGSSMFEVDKSYDRVNFRKIGSVPASGTKFTPSSYTLTDPEKVEFNYYRVRMMHADGYLLVSDTILVKNDNAQQQMYVLTNPFQNDIRVRFARAPRSQVVLSLFDMSGKLIRKQSFAPSSTVFFNVSAFSPISSGVYVLDAYVDGKHYTARLKK